VAPRVAVDDRGLVVGGEGIDLLAGAMHYWRVPRAHWAACLRGIKALGFEIVETYVPWGVHDRRGSFDFRSPQVELGAFLDLAHEEGLRAIVRPGPHINAELTWFGLPERIVRDARMQARSAAGTPIYMPAPPRMFPIPSYASRELQREVAVWLSAVGEIVGPRRAPAGPVIAAQVDNELQQFFRIGAFDQDYHPEALAWWDEWTGGLEAPRRWAVGDAARCLKWVAFKDEYAARSLAWIAAAMRAAGFDDIPLVHNFPPTEPETVHLPSAEDAIGGVVGFDFYHRRADYKRLRRRALYLAGSARTLPFAPEVGLGGPLWLPPMTPKDQRNTIRGLLMAGVRALSFFMAVDRERWYGAPLGVDGSERPEVAPFVKRLLQVLKETRFSSLRRRAEVALIMSRAHARLANASSLADPLSPVVTDPLGLGALGAAELARDERARGAKWGAQAALAVLDESRLPFAIVDESLSAARLAQYTTIVAPTGTLVDRDLLATLRQCAERGAKIILGPVRPSRDQWDTPLEEDLPAAAIFAGDANALRAALPSAPATWIAQPGVDCAVYADADQRARVLFVGTGASTPIVASVTSTVGTSAEDLFSGETLREEGGALAVPLEPQQVRMFVLS
jgi:beta-galactosidase